MNYSIAELAKYTFLALQAKGYSRSCCQCAQTAVQVLARWQLYQPTDICTLLGHELQAYSAPIIEKKSKLIIINANFCSCILYGQLLANQFLIYAKTGECEIHNIDNLPYLLAHLNMACACEQEQSFYTLEHNGEAHILKLSTAAIGMSNAALVLNQITKLKSENLNPDQQLARKWHTPQGAWANTEPQKKQIDYIISWAAQTFVPVTASSTQEAGEASDVPDIEDQSITI